MRQIEINNLQYRYPMEERLSLKNINLNVEKGDFILICGKTGCGKSTLARSICGSIPFFYGGTIGGEILFNGKNTKDLKREERAQEITMVFQDPEKSLIMNKVIKEVAFGLENIGIAPKEIRRRVWEALEFTGISHLSYRDINTLSGGEKQKVAIACALSYSPKCIVLDEPTSQLDPSFCEDMANIVKKINNDLGITIIIIEQKMDKWFELSDRVVVMKEGEIFFNGTKDQMYNMNDAYCDGFLPSYLRLAKKVNCNTKELEIKKIKEKFEGVKFNKKEAASKIDSEMNPEIIIEVKNLRSSYEDKAVLKDINFKLCKGEFLCLAGANGAGKSTLVKAIMGLTPYKGNIKVKNIEVKSRGLKNIGKTIGYVSQYPGDYLSLDTVYDEIAFTLKNHKCFDTLAVEDTLNSLGLFELKDKNPKDLSGGERQRVAIASIIVLKPDILLLDEPTRGLDEEVKRKLGRLLSELNNKGITIIMVSHDIEFCCSLCNRFILMFEGEVVADGTKEEVLSTGLYYTTTINKILRDRCRGIFTLKDALLTMSSREKI